MSRVEILLATVNQKDMTIADEMKVTSPIVITNQADTYRYSESEGGRVRMLTTDTKGVGINRNLGLLLAREDILLFSDDDMIYIRGYEDCIISEFERNPDADVIIFSIDKIKNGKSRNIYINKTNKRIHLKEAMKYGTFSIAIRKKAVKKANLHFTTLFGGGSLYGSGEDSLFIVDCLRAGLHIYTSAKIIAVNTCKESTWFRGFNEKYFYDKGAFIAAAFPKWKWIFLLYFIFRLRKVSDVKPKEQIRLLCAGYEGLAQNITYTEWVNDHA